MRLETLKDLFVNELKDVFDAEHQILKALPKMTKAASLTELQTAFEEHLQQTKGHVTRLEQVFEIMGERAQRKKCDGMKGLLEEGESLMEEDAEASVRDAGLIAGAQRVEHYEMAAYGSLKSWATQLNNDEAAGLLEETLAEEKAADQKLSEIANSAVNPKAADEKENESRRKPRTEGKAKTKARAAGRGR